MHRWVHAGLVWVLLAVGTSGLQAAIWDLATDWSDAANPNGVWSLKKNHADLFTINQADYFQNGTNQPCWADEPFPQNAHVPFWMKQNEDGLVNAHGAELDRTGSDYTAAVWTSPLAGDVQISGAVWNTWYSDRDMRWQLWVNGIVVSEGDLHGGGTHYNLADGSGGAAALAQTVQVGDQLELGLLSVSEEGNLGDGLGIAFTITPEPATLALVALGGLGVLVRRRRK